VRAESRTTIGRVGPTLVAVALWIGACGQTEEAPRPARPDPVVAALEQGFQVDTVGVRDLARGDSLNRHAGLTIIETTVGFDPAMRDGEVVAWEFRAVALHPVKLLLVRYAAAEKSFELVGESPMVVPERLGVNRVALPEPIPVTRGTLFGIYQPEAGVIPYRQVRNWKTLIAAGAFQRPFTPRSLFSMYGWRYAARVFCRHGEPGETAAAVEAVEADSTGDAP